MSHQTPKRFLLRVQESQAAQSRLVAEQNISVKVFDPKGIATKASRVKTAIGNVRLLGDGSGSVDFRSAPCISPNSFLKSRVQKHEKLFSPRSMKKN